jgi:hypothetical protein
MLTVDALKKMCAAPEPGRAYYRPLVCRGDLSKVSIFLAGINPATPIRPEDLALDEYVQCILDYDRFLRYYLRTRPDGEKSRTRKGIDSFVGWVQQRTSRSVAETNVIAYPTENTKALKQVPDWIKGRGGAAFYELVVGFEPGLIMLHGKKAVEECISLFERKGLLRKGAVDVPDDIRMMETCSPLFRFRWAAGAGCNVLACRHFIYYGTSGRSFAGFRSIVEQFLPE